MENLESAVQEPQVHVPKVVYKYSSAHGKPVKGLPGITAGKEYVVKGVREMRNDYFVKITNDEGQNFEFDCNYFMLN